MKRLLVYLKEYRKESILAPLFKLLEAFFELMVPLVMAAIIDRGIGQQDNSFVLKMGLCLVVLALVGLVSAVTAQFFAAKAAVGFSTKLRQALFNHIQDLNFTNMDKAGTSTMITRMTSDINQVQSGVNMVLRLFLRSPIIVFGAMIMAFTIDWQCALVFVVAIPLLAIVVFGIMLITIPLYKKVQGNVDRVLGITRENLTGVRVIRAFHREEAEQESFEEQNKALAGIQMFVGRISACMNPVTYVIVNAATIVLIYGGAIKVQSGLLTTGEVVAILNYMSQILVELVKLANLIILMTKAFACADRVAAVFEIENKESWDQNADQSPAEPMTKSRIDLGGELPDAKSGVPFLEFKNVSLTYEGAGEKALDNISFKVEQGDTIGIIGGTGSGKTSLVNLLPSFYPATEGQILLNGCDIKKLNPIKFRQLFGIVPQKAVLFVGTIRSNLLWGKTDASDEDMWRALELAQAKEVVEGKDGGLDALVAQNGRNFSGGQRQRLTIARALVRKPQILILDDSASALDYATDAKLRAAIKTLQNETTTFIVSQRASTIRHANLIIVLDDGKLAGTGTHDALLENCEVYREIYYSQYPEERKNA